MAQTLSSRMRTIAAGVCTVVLSAAAAGAAPDPIGSVNPVRVNASVLQYQQQASVASDAAGHFVAVWLTHNMSAGGVYTIQGQRYDAAGAPFGPVEFQINSLAVSSASAPSVAFAPDGSYFVVAWAVTGANPAIMVRRFTGGFDGTLPAPLEASELAVVLGPYVAAPAVATTNSGFVIAWLDLGNASLPEFVYAQRFNADTSAVGAPILIGSPSNNGLVKITTRPALAADGDGDFVVAFQRCCTSLSVIVTRYDAASAALNPSAVISSTAVEPHPSVGMWPNGDFIVAFDNRGSVADDVFAQRFSYSPATGLVADPAVKLSTTATGSIHQSAIAVDADGNALIVWRSAGVFGAWASSNGTSFTTEFAVNQSVTQDSDPQPASIADGKFAVAWTDPTRDANGTSGIYAKLVTYPADLVVSSFSAPSYAAAGVTYSVQAVVFNRGHQSSAATTTRVVWSTTPTYDPSAPVLAALPTGAIDANQAETESFSITIPSGSVPGVYYLIAVADAANVVAEAVESNNTLVHSVVIGKDITVASFSAPRYATRGSTITITDVIENVSGSSTGTFTVAYGWSSDPTPSSNDSLFAVRAVSLAANPDGAGCGMFRWTPEWCSRFQQTVTISPMQMPGTYYLIVWADVTNAIHETNETNNIRVIPVTIW
jgi:hypothetical protein